ncbi:MAG TPA: hypothetical protein VE075_04635 [Thermoanaerobaculia bacterium]|nr:hypothetical protein [Thermoanaerobaculia bacterium]
MNATDYVVENLANFTPAQASPREQVLMRYCNGRGRFSQDKQYINLQMQMFDPYGRPDGYMAGVWQALFTSPQQLLAIPPQPQRPFSVPVGPVPALPPSANTKGTWTFGDGSAITAVGPAMTTLTQLPDGRFLFMVATMQWITNGTGRYAGSQGLKSSLGSTYVPPGVDLFSPSYNQDFDATTIDTFRVMPGQYIGAPPKL